MRAIEIVVAFFALTLAVSARGAELKAADGRVVEVAIDFQLTDIQVSSDGVLSCVANGVYDGTDVGFALTLHKPIPWTGSSQADAATLVLQNEIEMRSLGSQTAALDGLLNGRLIESNDDRSERTCVGPYHGISPVSASSLSGVVVYQVTDVGLTFDSTGKLRPAECFWLVLSVDAPMRRLTAHFHIPAGYGGTPEAYRVRDSWYKSKTPSQPPQHNAGNRPSSDDSSASETPSSLGPRG